MSRVTLEQLEALCLIVRLGSFRAAATRLNVSQPAISSRIREIERQAGFPVVRRGPAGAVVTRRGREVLRYAEQMVALDETLAARFTAADPLGGIIRIGVADSFAMLYLSRLLKLIGAASPYTHVEIDVDYSASLDRKLAGGLIDLAVLTEPTVSAAVTMDSLIDMELGWFASRRSRFPRGTLEPLDLYALPILTNPPLSHLHRTILGWFDRAALVPQRLSTCNSLAVIKQLTLDGFGLAMLPVALVGRDAQDGELRRIRCRPALPPSLLYAACPANLARRLRPVVELAREAVRRSMP